MKNHLSALLEQVREGETVIITDHGRPVAQLTAVAPGGKAATQLDALQRKGLLRRGGGQRCMLGDPVVPRDGASALAALLDERAEGR
jgi:prevent-host-death family protein